MDAIWIFFVWKPFNISGDGQKIVSFSVYGELKSAYYDGVKDNLETLDVSNS